MALNPVVYTEAVARRAQSVGLTVHQLPGPRLLAQMRMRPSDRTAFAK